MTNDLVLQLVEDADAAGEAMPAALPRADDLLAALAARRQSRRRRRGVAVACVLAAALVGWRATVDRRQAEPRQVADALPAVAIDVEAMRTRLAELDEQASMQLQIVKSVVGGERPAATHRPAARPVTKAGVEYSQELARTAALSWRYAELVEQEFGDAAAARRQYQRVAARFPGTPWAHQAAESLRRLSAPENSQQL